jgi:CDP-glycerol glycerophosphotransferase
VLFFLDKEIDIYPYLKVCDLLVTDYSSVFFDFLLLAKPLIFFPYDLERYRSRDRQLYFDYNDFVCGPQALTQEELQLAIASILRSPSGDDIFAARREDILKRSFDFRDGCSCERLYKKVVELT